MEKQHGPWVIRRSSEVYRDSFIRVASDDVTRPDGKPGHYATVSVKPGVAVLPVDERGVVYLIRQFRYALGAESLEVCCGGVEDGDSSLDAGKRELAEELGIQADEWIALGAIDLDTSIVRCSVGLYVARGLSFDEPDREGTEVMRSVAMPLDEAVRRVEEGGITHAASCVLLLRARRLVE